MKNLLFWLTISIFSFLNIVSANVLPNSIIKTLDNVVVSMCEYREDLPQNEQRLKYSQIIDFLTRIDSRLNFSQKQVANYIKDSFSEKLSSMFENNASAGSASYNIANVDMEQVNNARLNRHNDARWQKWIYAYQRDPDLAMTAHTRATVLASRNRTDHSSHKRDLSDPYYDYDKITNWFSDLWVGFDGGLFTENVAYQYYSCNKDDCTQDLINAIWKAFKFFTDESEYNGPHYRWIMNKNYTKMWMWVALVWKRYWIVTHYGKRENK